MGESYHYVCEGCRFDVVAGSVCVECPHCGEPLRLIAVTQMKLPDPPGAIAELKRAVPVGMYRAMFEQMHLDIEDMLRRAAEEKGE